MTQDEQINQLHASDVIISCKMYPWVVTPKQATRGDSQRPGTRNQSPVSTPLHIHTNLHTHTPTNQSVVPLFLKLLNAFFTRWMQVWTQSWWYPMPFYLAFTLTDSVIEYNYFVPMIEHPKQTCQWIIFCANNGDLYTRGNHTRNICTGFDLNQGHALRKQKAL